jgi:hypothetical protein
MRTIIVPIGVLFIDLLCPTGTAAQSNTGTYSLTSASAMPSAATASGSCFAPMNGLSCAQLTLSATLNDTTTADAFLVRVDLTPNGSAPAIDMTTSSFVLTTANQNAGYGLIGETTTTSFDAFITNIGKPVGGTIVLGTLYIPIPATAQNGNTYTLTFPSGDESAGNSVSGASIAMSAGNSGTITIVVPPRAAFSAIALNFGSQAVGVPSSTQTVTLTNSGGQTLTVGGISSSGNFAQTNNCGALAASSACTINVTFTPTATGALRGSVVIVDNAAGSPQVIRLLGTGSSAAMPAIGFSNISLNFGNQTTGTPSSAQTIKITNTGSATLTVTAVAATGDFAASGCLTSLSAGATCTLSVTFTPTVTGARHGAVAISDNAAGSPQVIRLFGSGT